MDRRSFWHGFRQTIKRRVIIFVVVVLYFPYHRYPFQNRLTFFCLILFLSQNSYCLLPCIGLDKRVLRTKHCTTKWNACNQQRFLLWLFIGWRSWTKRTSNRRSFAWENQCFILHTSKQRRCRLLESRQTIQSRYTEHRRFRYRCIGLPERFENRQRWQFMDIIRPFARVHVQKIKSGWIQLSHFERQNQWVDLGHTMRIEWIRRRRSEYNEQMRTNLSFPISWFSISCSVLFHSFPYEYKQCCVILIEKFDFMYFFFFIKNEIFAMQNV